MDNNNKDYYSDAITQIHSNPQMYEQYIKLSSNPSWKERFDDFLRGTKTLPLLYDPFFKAIFNADIHREQLSELISAILGQEVSVVEVIPNEDSTYMGALIIMDIVVRMSDGSLANGENVFSYKNLRHVHTIIFYERSSEKLISSLDEKFYFHVGRTIFNTGIDVELLQDFHLISLDTFIKYRYSDIINGDTTVTRYDYDESVYKNELSDDMKQKRLMYLMLLTTDNVCDMDRLLKLYPQLAGIISDINEYISRPWEVLNMFSEALRILDKNSMDLLIDEMKQEVDKAHAEVNRKQTELDYVKAEQEASQAEIARLKAEIEALKKA